MSESADSEHSNQLAVVCSAVAKRIKCRDTCTHERCCLKRSEIIRDRGHRNRRRHHILSVTAVERNTGRKQCYVAGKEVSAPAPMAISAMTTVPADTHFLADSPGQCPFT